MKYTINAHYNHELISEGVLAYWKKTVFRTFILSLALMVFASGRIIVFDLDWKNDALLWLSIIPPFMCVAAFYIYRKRSLAIFKEMDAKTAELTFSSEGFFAKSDTGSAEIKWKMFKGIIKNPNTWVFVYKNNSYNVIPLADVPDEVLEFISVKVIALIV